MSGIVTWFGENWEGVLFAATAVVTAASAIANLTPTDADNKIVAFVKKVVDFFALNWKKPAA